MIHLIKGINAQVVMNQLLLPAFLSAEMDSRKEMRLVTMAVRIMKDVPQIVSQC